MATGFWLVDNPPDNPQSRCPRRDPLSGTVLVHCVADAGPGWVRPINVARFIQHRPACPNCGSYHHLIHPDEDLALLPPTCEAFQAETGSNRFGWSVSFCCDPLELTLDPGRPVEAAQTDRALRRAGKVVARFAVDWATAKGNPARALTVARWISGADANAAVPGMAEHWEVQKYNRSDALRANPERGSIRAALVGYVHDEVMALIGDGPAPEPTEEIEMVLVRRKSDGAVYCVTGNAAVPVRGGDDYKAHVAKLGDPIQVSDEQWDRYTNLKV